MMVMKTKHQNNNYKYYRLTKAVKWFLDNYEYYIKLYSIHFGQLVYNSGYFLILLLRIEM